MPAFRFFYIPRLFGRQTILSGQPLPDCSGSLCPWNIKSSQIICILSFLFPAYHAADCLRQHSLIFFSLIGFDCTFIIIILINRLFATKKRRFKRKSMAGKESLYDTNNSILCCFFSRYASFLPKSKYSDTGLFSSFFCL